MKKSIYILSSLVIGLMVLIGNGAFRQSEEGYFLDSLLIRKQFSSSPVLTAQESMEKMQLADGFKVKLVAAEPLLNSPVALVFDKKERIWVAEMDGYMPDTAGTGEDQPRGRIVILSDSNGDGLMDDRKIFLDSLILPRALCLIGNGLLVAEPPRLWFYEISNDKPVKKILVDSAYAEGGNVEHQPNGLLRGLDNWIYSAKSDKRYRKKGDKWLIEKTHFRGQWGITQDDEGRLFYNTNSENLLGDLFAPGFGAMNNNQKGVSGFNKKMVVDQKVYPARANTGVNRGYQPGVLDDSLRLIKFTAACGPVIYNGGLFSKEFNGNAFVAEPSANLIKRNILVKSGYSIEGTQAYSNKEFLRSTDERFRPINLYNGPDGALYIVDMYRGIIQHKTYLTPYLKNEIEARSLTQPLSFGRIYKVIPLNTKLRKAKFPNDRVKLVKLLGDKNGWIRNMAQQLLVDAGDRNILSELKKLLKTSKEPLAITHALWTMEGLGILSAEDILPFLKQAEWPLQMQALSVSSSVISKENYKDFLGILNELIKEDNSQAAPYIAFLSGTIKQFDPDASGKLLQVLSKKFSKDLYVSDAIISTLKNEEMFFYSQLDHDNLDTTLILNTRLKKVIEETDKAKKNKPNLALEFPRGAAIFKSNCQTCHGSDGNGITSLAPPLNNSNWVVGNKNHVSGIVLYGLTGPIKIGNKLYEAPEINGEMPGIASNKDFSDEDIADLLNYIRTSWNNKGEKVRTEEVTATRNKFKGRQRPFTMQELNSME